MAIQHRTDTTVTFARDEGADAVLGCVSMFSFILPGLLYLLLANRTARVTVATYPYEGGSQVVTGGNADQYIGELAA